MVINHKYFLIYIVGLSGITGISRVPSTIQQPTNASAATYTLLEPAVVQQPVNLSNSMPGVIPGAIWQCTSSSDVQNANGVTYAPLAPTLFQQLINSSNNTSGEIPTIIRKRKYSPNSDWVRYVPTVAQQPTNSSNAIQKLYKMLMED